MKSRAAWTGLLALGSALLGRDSRADAPQPLPTPYPESRYHQMSARSPFAIATATAAVTAKPDFAAQLYVDGVAHIGKIDYVAIKSRDPDKVSALFLHVGEVTDDGLKVERVDWSDETGKSTVEISKAGTKAMLSFDQAQIVTSPVSQPASARPFPAGLNRVNIPQGFVRHRRDPADNE